MRFYVATGLENAAAARAVIAALTARGHRVTYDWTTHGSVQHESSDTIARVASAELRGVMTADVVVALLPGGRGTHVELGVALGAVLAGDMRAVVLAGEEPPGPTCVFYHHPCLTWSCDTSPERLADLVESLL